MKTLKLAAFLFPIILSGVDAIAQIESPVLVFNRGMLWQSVFFGKIGPNFNNWGRRGIGLDWPGFDQTWIGEDIGGPPSHMVSGGFWVGAKKKRDSVMVVEDWSMYGSTVSSESNAKYRVTRHYQKYKNGANYWLASAPNEGEEVIETEWEYNLNYTNVDDRERQLPVRVRRTMHQWNGSRRDENYIIHEYVFRNISPEIKAAGRTVVDTLLGFRLLVNYGLHVNSRSWTVLFPTLTPGARNTWFFYDPARRMIWGRAGDYRETVANEDYCFVATQGPIKGGKPTGEWLAPGFVGIRLLYSSPDSSGLDTRISKYGWSAASNSIDLSGPFTGLGTNEAKYAVLVDPANAAGFVASSSDTVYMRRSRMWSMMALGPWDILPGDSIVVTLAEIVDGVDYRVAVDPATTAVTIGTRSSQIFLATADKAKFTYDQRRAGKGFNHPDPPAAPRFEVGYYTGTGTIVANELTWATEAEGIPDPDDGTLDLAGYRIYRSSYLPIGPWDSVATITRRDLKFYNVTSGKYVFVDSVGLQIGTNYYYTVTAYDTGKASWPVNPTAFFPDTRSSRVPALETSLFANRKVTPFRATIPRAGSLGEIVVVPNPFITRTGDLQRGEQDLIQFVNLPNPCTIRIYTVRGDLVATIEQGTGAGGVASWRQTTDYGQYVESGVYIFHVDSPVGTKTGKFAIVR